MAMDLKCTACGSPYHPSTGHVLSTKPVDNMLSTAKSENTILCGPCALDFKNWIRGMMSRRWGGVKFYDHAYTSSNKMSEKEVDTETSTEVQKNDGGQ